MAKPTTAPDTSALEELLSRPTPALVDAMRRIEGDILILGASGKMGPTFARLAQRASDEAGSSRRIIASARFSDPDVPRRLRNHGIETLVCDLLDSTQYARLVDAPNVIHMVGQKFGTTGEEAKTWAVNGFLPGLVADRFKNSRIVAFSTGNVYPMSPVDSNGPSEHDPVGPIGEYAQSALARERVLTFFSQRHYTAMAILRLNYAVEPRYGVLRDIADRVWSGQPVDLTMSQVNVIWQRDANAVALMALEQCAVPPFVLNVTGPSVAVRAIAEAFGARWQKTVQFTGDAKDTALLSDPLRMNQVFGTPSVTLDTMIDHVAAWIEAGGGSLGKPTHFEQREGRF